MALAPGMKLGAYEIVAPIGAGGMGEVYRARDARLEREVAVKVLPARLSDDSVALARFEREAKAVAALSHPAILAIFDFGTAGGVAYAVTELLDGETLRARLAGGPLPVRRAVEYAVQIAEGLGAAHEKGIVHRDLKPENLFVTNDGRVKILDFGLARQTIVPHPEDTSSPTLSRHTEPGTILGTVGYMSPEQVRGLHADQRSDVFSFGAVLYEMLSGQRAFKGDSAAETMNAILKDDPPDLLETNRSLPPALERLVRHCLEKRPEQRFRSVHDVAFDLQALSPSTGSRMLTSVPTAAVTTRRTLAIAAVLAAVFALGVLADRALRKAPSIESPTYHRLTFDLGTVGAARFAPDGNTIVYNAAWRGAPSEVFTARLDSHESRPLGLRGAIVYGVSAVSELAVGLDAAGPLFESATLSRVPLAGGAPREVLENVTYADWSPDGVDLAAVVRNATGTTRLEFPIGSVVYETKGDIGHVRVSPRGDCVAFLDHPDPTNHDAAGSVVAIDRNGTKRTLSSGWADLFGLAWRPDGREVWFTAGKRDEFKALRAVTLAGEERLVARMLGQIDLEDISRDGRVLIAHPSAVRFEMMAFSSGESKERELTWLGGSDLVDLSEDGSRVLFTEVPEGEGEGGFTYVRKTDGSPAVRLGEGRALALSPDGKWAQSRLTSPSRLVLLSTGVGTARSLTRPGMTYLGWGSWFPDSRRVLFTATLNSGSPRAYVQDIEGGEPRAIGPEGIQRPMVSPDGRAVVALAQDAKAFLYPIDGGEPRAVRGLEAGDLPVRWSVDGRSLFFCRNKVLASQVYRLDLATGRTELWLGLAAADPAGVFRLHVCVTPDGKSFAYSYHRILSDLFLIEGLK